MERIKVVGVGPGTEDYLTPAAQKAAAWADVLVGGRKSLALFKGLGKPEVVLDGRLERAVAFIKENRNKKIAVLVSGDPGFFSFLAYLRRHFAQRELEVIPGISSVQVAFARACLPWQDAGFFSLHGRNGDRVMAEGVLPAVEAGKKVAVLAGSDYTPQKVASFLLQRGVRGVRLLVAGRLTYPEEKVVAGSLEFMANCPEEFNGCVVLIADEF